MFKRLLHEYLPYGAIDLLLLVAIVSEIVMGNVHLLWANLPLLIVGIWSFNRKLRRMELDDTAD